MTEPPPNAEIPEADLRQLAYDAAVACLAANPDVPRDLVSRNAVAWLAIHAVVDAILGARKTPDNSVTSSDAVDNSEGAAIRLEIDLNDRTHDGLVPVQLPAGITVEAGQQVTAFESEDAVAAPATVRTVALGQALLDVDWNAMHDDPPAKEDR